MAKRERMRGAVDAQALLTELRNRERRKKGRRKFFLRLLVIAGLVYALFTFVIGVAVVRGDSMAPAVPNGSFVLFLRVGDTYRVGDVAVAGADGKTVVKRVTAVGGDTLSFDEASGTLAVNGRAENYGVGGTLPRGEAGLTVSAEHLYLLGDNREMSTDSRDFGEVATSAMLGKVFFVVKGG